MAQHLWMPLEKVGCKIKSLILDYSCKNSKSTNHLSIYLFLDNSSI